jgi:pimeloyl-ACP methyl ester carboxylesterase
MMEEVAENVSFAIIEKEGHWLTEENPCAVARALIDFDALILGHYN